ncbi:DNA translocase FtsK [Indioceanicola profundi]|uniref:DNA translocase FtsK n=1 Tax=Indioceanicola profundi TaxID=2220096 RepID=UPI000E6AD4C9|nr:DNA translocase FtsK [Indioceanicola profundi]
MTIRATASRSAPRGAASRRPANTGKGRLMPEEAARFLKRRMVELGGLVLLLLGAAVAAALATYAPTDPSWSTAVPGDSARVLNLLGLPGAYTADVLVQALGVSAYLISALLAGWGIAQMRHRDIGGRAVRVVVGLGSVLLTATAMAGLGAGGSAMLLGGSTGVMLMNLIMQASLGLIGYAHALGTGLILLVPALFALLSALGVAPREVAGGIRGLLSGKGKAARKGSAGLAGIVGGVLNAPVALGGKIADALTGAVADFRAKRSAAPARPAPRPRAEPALAPPRSITLKKDMPDPEQEPERERLRAPAPPAPPPAPVEEEDAEEPRKSRFAAIVAPRPKPPEPARKPARQPVLSFEPAEDGVYELPPLDVLQMPDPASRAAGGLDEEALRQNAALLEGVLEDFGVRGEIVKVSPGPVVTLYELEPAPGTKSSRVIGLADDIARSMSAISVRVAVVPGRNVIGIELPNRKRETVYFRELLETEAYAKTQAKLALVLGKDIGGGPVIADLARMPHLLVAGTTGSGKSVAINTMILSLLYRLPPDKCRFIMVDPKMLELSIYEGIPHLLAPVVTDPGKAVVALKWAVREMEDRYRSMSKLGVRNIDGYNARLKEAREAGEVLTRRVQTGFDPDTGKPIFEEQPIDLTELPYIVVIVDEMADLMLVAGKDIEAAIQRLAQMARAAGIHLIMATQRPSVDVITGTIKANFPTRISFQVTSKIDSRTILGEQGAEQLLGQGDMLYMAGGGRITRVHGPFVKDEEVELIVRHLKAQGEPMYVEAVTEEEDDTPFDSDDGEGGGNAGGSGDDLYDQAVAVVTRERKASTSFIQRHLRIGYNSAARLIERMEKEGVVSKANHVGKREVLARDIEDHERVN